MLREALKQPLEPLNLNRAFRRKAIVQLQSE